MFTKQAICEVGNPTNTHSGELFRMLDILILIVPIFEIHKRIRASHIVQYGVKHSILTVNLPLHW